MSTKHYEELKVISDSLGLGVKRTIEHLITHYSRAEGPRSGPALGEKQGMEKLGKRLENEARKPILVGSESVSRYEIHSEIPSGLASRINPRLIELKDRASTLIPSGQIPLKPISKYKLLEPGLDGVKGVLKCSCCDAPRRETARFCYNCGNQVKY